MWAYEKKLLYLSYTHTIIHKKQYQKLKKEV